MKQDTRVRQIRLPAPHPGQIHVRRTAKRFNYLAAGRRWHKSTLFVALALEGLHAGKRVIWGAPSYKQVQIGWEECVYAAGGALDFRVSDGIVLLPGTTGRIYFRTLEEPENARGLTADLVFLDEAPLIRSEAWYNVILPMISETKGDAFLGGTPNGRDWFYKEHRDAVVLNSADSMSWQIPTCGAFIKDGQLIRKPHPYENPNFPFEELERQFRILPENVFLQEYLAEFVQEGGMIFRNVDARATAQRQERAIPGHQYIIACDFAKLNDWTVIGVGDLTLKHLVYMERFNMIDYTLQLERLQDVFRRFTYEDRNAGRKKPVSVMVPVAGIGNPLAELIQRAGLPMMPIVESPVSNKEMVESLSIAFDRDPDFAIIADPILINEHKAYTAKRLPSGMLRYQAPDGEHDDTVAMMRILWQGMAPYEVSNRPRKEIILPQRDPRLSIDYSQPRPHVGLKLY